MTENAYQIHPDYDAAAKINKLIDDQWYAAIFTAAKLDDAKAILRTAAQQAAATPDQAGAIRIDTVKNLHAEGCLNGVFTDKKITDRFNTLMNQVFGAESAKAGVLYLEGDQLKDVRSDVEGDKQKYEELMGTVGFARKGLAKPADVDFGHSAAGLESEQAMKQRLTTLLAPETGLTAETKKKAISLAIASVAERYGRELTATNPNDPRKEKIEQLIQRAQSGELVDVQPDAFNRFAAETTAADAVLPAIETLITTLLSLRAPDAIIGELFATDEQKKALTIAFSYALESAHQDQERQPVSRAKQLFRKVRNWFEGKIAKVKNQAQQPEADVAPVQNSGDELVEEFMPAVGVLQKVSPEVASQLKAQIEIHGSNGSIKQTDIETGDLYIEGLQPEYKAMIEGKVTFFSKPFNLGEGRIAVIGYLPQDDGTFVARSFYRSNSQGVWRYLPNALIEQDGAVSWYGKGRDEQAITLPFVIQKALAEISTKEPVLTVSGPSTLFVGTTHDITHTNTLLLTQAPQAERLAGDFYAADKKTKIAPENLNFTDEQQKPDFAKRLATWEMSSSLYGTVTAEVFPSKDQRLRYLFCSDSKGRVWIGGVENDSAILTTGVRQRWMMGGDLMTPPYEYLVDDVDQTGGYGSESDRSGSYVDMYQNYLSKVPIVQEYLAAKQAGSIQDVESPAQADEQEAPLPSKEELAATLEYQEKVINKLDEAVKTLATYFAVMRGLDQETATAQKVATDVVSAENDPNFQAKLKQEMELPQLRHMLRTIVSARALLRTKRNNVSNQLVVTEENRADIFAKLQAVDNMIGVASLTLPLKIERQSDDSPVVSLNFATIPFFEQLDAGDKDAVAATTELKAQLDKLIEKENAAMLLNIQNAMERTSALLTAAEVQGNEKDPRRVAKLQKIEKWLSPVLLIEPFKQRKVLFSALGGAAAGALLHQFAHLDPTLVRSIYLTLGTGAAATTYAQEYAFRMMATRRTDASTGEEVPGAIAKMGNLIDQAVNRGPIWWVRALRQSPAFTAWMLGMLLGSGGAALAGYVHDMGIEVPSIVDGHSTQTDSAVDHTPTNHGTEAHPATTPTATESAAHAGQMQHEQPQRPEEATEATIGAAKPPAVPPHETNIGGPSHDVANHALPGLSADHAPASGHAATAEPAGKGMTYVAEATGKPVEAADTIWDTAEVAVKTVGPVVATAGEVAGNTDHMPFDMDLARTDVIKDLLKIWTEYKTPDEATHAGWEQRLPSEEVIHNWTVKVGEVLLKHGDLVLGDGILTDEEMRINQLNDFEKLVLKLWQGDHTGGIYSESITKDQLVKILASSTDANSLAGVGVHVERSQTTSAAQTPQITAAEQQKSDVVGSAAEADPAQTAGHNQIENTIAQVLSAEKAAGNFKHSEGVSNILHIMGDDKYASLWSEKWGLGATDAEAWSRLAHRIDDLLGTMNGNPDTFSPAKRVLYELSQGQLSPDLLQLKDSLGENNPLRELINMLTEKEGDIETVITDPNGVMAKLNREMAFRNPDWMKAYLAYLGQQQPEELAAFLKNQLGNPEEIPSADAARSLGMSVPELTSWLRNLADQDVNQIVDNYRQMQPGSYQDLVRNILKLR